TAITEAVADIPDKDSRVMVAGNAATSSIWEKGRRDLIMVLAPVDSAALGLLDSAAQRRLERGAIIGQDGLPPTAGGEGTGDLARSKGLDVVFSETYAAGTADFAALLTRVKDTSPDALVAASVRLDDLVAIVRQMRQLDLNVKMATGLPYGLLPEFY